MVVPFGSLNLGFRVQGFGSYNVVPKRTTMEPI